MYKAKKPYRHDFELILKICETTKSESNMSDLIFATKILNWGQLKKLLALCIKYELIGALNTKPETYLVKTKGKQLLELLQYGYTTKEIPELA